MADDKNAKDIMGVFKDIWKTGTDELSKNMGSVLTSTPTKESSGGWGLPKVSWNQISVEVEKREKEIIDRRKW